MAYEKENAGKIGNSKNEILRGVMRISSTGQTREQ